MIKNPLGRMVPYNPNMVLPYNTHFQGPSVAMNQAQHAPFRPGPPPPDVSKIYSLPEPEYITAVVVQKRNIYLEENNVPDYQANDVYEIVSFYTSHKNGAAAYTDYKPVNTDKWRVVAKHFKKIQHNVPFDITTCETLESLTF